MRYVVTMLASVFLAAAVATGASTLGPNVSQASASGGGYVKTCGGGKLFLDASEKRTVALHNEIRRDRDLRPFCVHPKLTKAARTHSKDMIWRDYFDHNTKGSGLDPGERLDSLAYDWRTYGENIAYGSGSYGEPNNIMDAWMKSDGHRHNILNKNFREIGVGAYTGTFRDYRDTTMYTVDFGSRP